MRTAITLAAITYAMYGTQVSPDNVLAILSFVALLLALIEDLKAVA